MKKSIIALILSLLTQNFILAGVVMRRDKDIQISIDTIGAPIIQTAFGILGNDYKNVFGGNLIQNTDATIYVGTLGNGSQPEKKIDQKRIDELRLYKEGFILTVMNNKLYILGSDKRGTAYGILELSRLLGVSPWEWWADSKPEKKKSLVLKNGFTSFQAPSVAHRGIFINDEDWGMMPWSSTTFEPTAVKGQIGPKTHARIFELLLRLRANTYWPAMHDCTVAFFLTPGNREMADRYGISIGTSHCEPMLRNTNAQWKTEGTGLYDYVNNRANILNFWEKRVSELAQSDNIYTLGIRGVHDSKMLGANTLEEQYEAIKNVLQDQRQMIAKLVNPKVEQVPQVFIPYKEVLDVYNLGLEIPQDLTLLWCDDNYGYIRHFPNAPERIRKGGNGVYYHISYWGRPHDYLWLATNHPAQLYTQMKMAYDKGAKAMWILNVGDIKPAEYLTELFLDMAWDINSISNNKEGLDNHLKSWLTREFGKEDASKLKAVMNEYYRLAYIRKPEFMGGTRTEESDPKYKIISDLTWSEIEIKQRINDYNQISDAVAKIEKQISSHKKDSWFQLIEYPVLASAQMNFKHLYGQLARHRLATWQQSDAAFDSIISLTDRYNRICNGKWNGMMNDHPRNLAVFGKVPRLEANEPLTKHETPLYVFNGCDYSAFTGTKPLAHGLATKVLPSA